MNEPLPVVPPENPEENNQKPSRTLPFSNWWPVLAGVMSGIILRFIFSGDAGGAYSAMTGSGMAAHRNST